MERAVVQACNALSGRHFVDIFSYIINLSRTWESLKAVFYEFSSVQRALYLESLMITQS